MKNPLSITASVYTNTENALAVDGDAGEGHDCQSADGLAEEARRLEDAEEKQVFDFGAGLLVGGTADDAIVVDAA